MKQSRQLAESRSNENEQAAGTVGSVKSLGAGWSEIINRQSEWVLQSYAAMFSPDADPRLLESNAAGHALSRSQAALARLRDAREGSEVMAIWGEMNTSAAAFVAGYWQQVMGVSVPSQRSTPTFHDGASKPERLTFFDASWPLGMPASMFKLFTAPMDMALQTARNNRFGSH